MAGCSSTLPADAIAPWQGPGVESDLRRWILGFAILAPHSHNLQSWLVDLHTEGEILLRCDLQRLLPQTDPYSRQIMLSHGTFLELLDLAARERRHRAEITQFPEGAYRPDAIDVRPVARVRLVPDPSVPKDPLFAQILKRHTNRNAYDLARPVSAAARRSMADAVRPHALRWGYIGADWAAGSWIQNITVLLVAGVQHLLLRSRQISTFGGVDLRSDAAWNALKHSLRELAQVMFPPAR